MTKGAEQAFFRIVPPAGSHALPLRFEPARGEASTILLPSQDVTHVLVRLAMPARVSAGPGASVSRLSRFAGLISAVQARVLGRPTLPLPRASASVTLHAADRQKRKALRKDLKILKLFGLGAQLLCNEPAVGLALGFSTVPPRRSAHRRSTLRLGVVAHLHFTDVWADIEASLACIPDPFGLIVTLTSPNPQVEQAIKAAYPEARVAVVANAGRDVRPFLALLDEGALDGFDIVCKIHSKKSIRDGRPTALGELWRRSALFDLIAGAGRLDEVLERFEADQHLGLLGPERFRIPNSRFSLHDAWGGNREQTLQMAKLLGLSSDFELDFFAGTMFWVRPTALTHLRGARLGDPAAYAPEAGRTDGAVEHALERLFTASVKKAGFSLGSLHPLPDVQSEAS